MKSFIELLKEAKDYTKKGKMSVFKEPISINQNGKSFDILAIGKDTNGNPLMQVELSNGKKKSVQIPYSIKLYVDNVIENGLDKKETTEMISVIFKH